MVPVVLTGAVLPGCVVATSSSDGNGGGFMLLLFALVLLVLVVTVARRAGTRRRPRGTVELGSDPPSTAMLRAELSVLADDVVRLEPRVELCEAAREDFDAATQRYRIAQVALDQAGADLDLVRLQRLVDEATWSMSRARAILHGRKPPDPPETLRRPGGHGEPAIQLDEQERPTYVGSPADFRSGWFGVGGGLFSGLLLGNMLGGFDGWMTGEEEPNADYVDGDGAGAGDDIGDW